MRQRENDCRCGKSPYAATLELLTGMAAIHPSAELGYASGAESYAAGRPGYPPDIIGWLRALGIGPGSKVLELGAGTGKFSRLLAATRATVMAVEPVAAMRMRLAAHNPDVLALSASAEAIPLGDETVDAVMCAQSFHWFATSRALDEIRRVLRPGGCLGLVWNVRDESVDWVAALSAIMAPFENGTPRYRSGAWRRLFPAEGFGALDEQFFLNPHIGPAEDVIVKRVMSVSFIAARGAAEQAEVALRVRNVIDAAPELAGSEVVAFPYVTFAFACRKIR